MPIKSVTDEIVFGFDLGTGSMAGVIRQGLEVIYAKSFHIKDPEFASTKNSSLKRRAARTRMAHRAREFWWNEQAKFAGLETLKEFTRSPHGDIRVVSVDDRLKREFPAKGEDVVYTSCLLRLMLVEGRVNELDSWQIYKAVHSAIQKRGYDRDIPWKNSEDARSKDKDEDEDSRIASFLDHLEELGIPEAYRLPCYYEAFRMGLWNPDKGITGVRQSHLAEPAGIESDKGSGYTAPRKMVIAEIKAILESIKKRYPKIDVDYVLYGPGREQYASIKIDNEVGLKRGKATDWQGLLGQKIPRFDNRVIGKCALIPRLNTCRATEPLYHEVHLLMALHRFSFRDSEGVVRRLTFDEFQKVYSSLSGKNPCKKIPMTKILAKIMGGRPIPGSTDLPAANSSGRSRFSRPALRMMKHALLTGKPASDILREVSKWPSGCAEISIKDNHDPVKGLVSADLRWIRELGDTPWERLYVPAMRLIEGRSSIDSAETVRRVIGDVNNPVVRHRLTLFHNLLREMRRVLKSKGLSDQPDHITVELVREDFMGEDAKKRLHSWQRANEASNNEAKAQVAQFGDVGNNAVLRYKLAKQQKFICPYTGKSIAQSSLGMWEIDHIVPTALGGPDAVWNKVLVHGHANLEKRDRTPWQWIGGLRDRWEEFETLVANMDLPSKTVKLMLSPDAQDLADRYTHLAETAWIAKLSAEVIRREFGWNDELGSTKRIHFASGGQTARVRRKYKLDRILSPEGTDDKNRSDIRHHMLDALVITFLRDWDRSTDRLDKFHLPDGVNRDWFKKYVDSHRPKVTGSSCQLEENFYGLGAEPGLMFKRSSVKSLGYTSDPKPKFSQKVLESRIKKIVELVDINLASVLSETCEKVALSPNPERAWSHEIEALRGRNGARIKRLKVPDKLVEEVLHLPATKLHGPMLVRPKGDHRGFLIINYEGKWIAQPVYAWQSIHAEKIRWVATKAKVAMFVKSGDFIKLHDAVDDLTPGVYKILTIMNRVQVCLGNLGSKTSKDALARKSINKIMEQGKATLVDG
ncbi:MAG: hypothetical protein FJ146_17130 [Deltaproteobacteria bacterium]|nr:hypothetical protein [Deltaproteobacteria bacterium]